MAESHAATRAISEFMGRYSPAHFVGTDGKTYETEAILSTGGSTLRTPWSIAFVDGGVNISVPVNNFSVLSGNPQPPFKINGTLVSYSDPTANFLPVTSSTRYQSLEFKFTVDDTSPAALNTTLVEIITGTHETPRTNTLGLRYAVLATLDMTLRTSTVYFTPYRITTLRNGDRQSTSNMFIY